jgi:hypothetical protein
MRREIQTDIIIRVCASAWLQIVQLAAGVLFVLGPAGGCCFLLFLSFNLAKYCAKYSKIDWRFPSQTDTGEVCELEFGDSCGRSSASLDCLSLLTFSFSLFHSQKKRDSLACAAAFCRRRRCRRCCCRCCCRRCRCGCAPLAALTHSNNRRDSPRSLCRSMGGRRRAGGLSSSSRRPPAQRRPLSHCRCL